MNILITPTHAAEVRRILKENDERNDILLRSKLWPALIVPHEYMLKHIVAYHTEISDNIDKLVEFEADAREYISLKVQLEMLEGKAAKKRAELESKLDAVWQKLKTEEAMVQQLNKGLRR